MFVPQEQDLYAWKNSSFRTRLVITQNGVPYDLTNHVPVLQIRVQPGQTGASIRESTTASGLAIVDATQGLLDFNIDTTSLAAFPALPVPFSPLILYWDLRLTPPAPNNVFPFIAGTGRFLLYAGVTR